LTKIGKNKFFKTRNGDRTYNILKVNPDPIRSDPKNRDPAESSNLHQHHPGWQGLCYAYANGDGGDKITLPSDNSVRFNQVRQAVMFLNKKVATHTRR
jgi:hypothetical protein